LRKKQNSETMQSEFIDSFNSKNIRSDSLQIIIKNDYMLFYYDKLSNNNQHDCIHYRQRINKRMNWSRKMNEFLRNTILNSHLDYKAIAIKFIIFLKSKIKCYNSTNH